MTSFLVLVFLVFSRMMPLVFVGEDDFRRNLPRRE